MRHIEIEPGQARGRMGRVFLLSGVVFFCIAGCGSGTKDTPPPPQTQPQQGPQTYFAPYVFNTTTNSNDGADLLQGPYIYEIDDTAHSFSESIVKIGTPKVPQVINAGKVPDTTQRGMLTLQTTVNYMTPDPNNLPKASGFAVELANRTGGLVQVAGQPVAPLVAAAQCPNLKTAQAYQFITIPGGGINSKMNGLQPPFWDPDINTAYGSVDITSDGTNVTFNNIHQSKLPSAGGGSPTQPSSSPKAGLCGPTTLGNTIAVPGQVITTNPGTNPERPPQATIGIGATGLLLEDNGVNTGTSASASENVLGDGTGAIGLPKPSNAIDINVLRGAQYLGFVYGAGMFSGNTTGPATGWFSHPVSFGFSTIPSSCASVAPNTGATIYGRDVTNDDPSTPPDGPGNCNLAIDLGKQDASNNGLFPSAMVWLGASYAANTIGKTPFSAVAIAGQLGGKNAIFLIGFDLVQPWVIYLLQSN